MRKHLLLISGLAVATFTVAAADNALGVYRVSYRLSDSSYTDTFTISTKLPNGTYAGNSSRNNAVYAEKQGTQLCAAEVDTIEVGRAWCFPVNVKASNKAFFIGRAVSRTKCNTGLMKHAL